MEVILYKTTNHYLKLTEISILHFSSLCNQDFIISSNYKDIFSAVVAFLIN